MSAGWSACGHVEVVCKTTVMKQVYLFGPHTVPV